MNYGRQEEFRLRWCRVGQLNHARTNKQQARGTRTDPISRSLAALAVRARDMDN